MLNQDSVESMQHVSLLIKENLAFVNKHNVPHPADDPDNDRHAVRRVKIAMTARLITVFLTNATGLIRCGLFSGNNFTSMLRNVKRLLADIAKVFDEGIFKDEDFGYELNAYWVDALLSRCADVEREFEGVVPRDNNMVDHVVPFFDEDEQAGEPLEDDRLVPFFHAGDPAGELLEDDGWADVEEHEEQNDEHMNDEPVNNDLY